MTGEKFLLVGFYLDCGGLRSGDRVWTLVDGFSGNVVNPGDLKWGETHTTLVFNLVGT